MSVEAMTWAWGQPDLTPSERLILVALADHASNDGACWPGLNGLAEKVALTRRTVRRIVSGLEDKGLLQRTERRASNGRQQANLIVLELEGAQEDTGDRGEEDTGDRDGGHGRPAHSIEPSGEPSEGTITTTATVGDLWQHIVEVCAPANATLTTSRARVLRRALNEAPLELCRSAIYGLAEYVKRTGKGKLDMNRVFVTRPGGSALADQIEWWATQSSTHQPQRHRRLPPHVRDGLITARNHPTARWVATLNGGLDGRWLTDDATVNAAYDRAVTVALERFGLRVVWREVVPGEGYVRLEFQEVTR